MSEGSVTIKIAVVTVVGAVLGTAGGYLLGTQAGYDRAIADATQRLVDSGLIADDLVTDVREIPGFVTEIGDASLTIETTPPSVNPLISGTPPPERTVLIDDATVIVREVLPDGNQGSIRTEAGSFDDLIVGTDIVVVSDRNILGLQEFTATEIRIQPRPPQPVDEGDPPPEEPSDETVEQEVPPPSDDLPSLDEPEEPSSPPNI